MSENFAWELFKNTGNLDAFMIMRNCDARKKESSSTISNKEVGEINGDSKD